MSNKSAIEHVYNRLAEGDFQAVFDVLEPDVEWIEAENIPYWPGGPTVGHEAVQKTVFDELGGDFADFHINVIKIIAGDSTVLVEGRYVGTTNTGNDLDAIFAHVWEFGDQGKVVRFQQYSDTFQWRRVLGVDV